jgi:hypothetical protein
MRKGDDTEGEVVEISNNVWKACSLFLAQQPFENSSSSGVTQCKQEHVKAQMEASGGKPVKNFIKVDRNESERSTELHWLSAN